MKQLFLWYHQDSNRGHTDFQSDALPTELWHRLFVLAGAKVRQYPQPTKFFAKFFRHLPHFIIIMGELWRICT